MHFILYPWIKLIKESYVIPIPRGKLNHRLLVYDETTNQWNPDFSNLLMFQSSQQLKPKVVYFLWDKHCTFAPLGISQTTWFPNQFSLRGLKTHDSFVDEKEDILGPSEFYSFNFWTNIIFYNFFNTPGE